MSSIPQDGGGAVAALPVRAQTTRWWVGPALGAGLIAALLLWVFWHFFSRQFRFAIHQQADWGHTLVIPLIAGYFVYLNRHRLLGEPLRTTWAGLLPVVAGVAFYMFCWLGPPAIRHHNLQGAGLSLTLLGLVLLFAGYRAMAWLWFPLAYLCIFGQTISERLLDQVTFRLQDITAVGSHAFLNLIGIETERSGNILVVIDGAQEKPLNIAEACSGMRMLMAFLALGVAMGYAGLPHLWQRVALVLLGIPVAIVVNVVRVTTLAVLSLADAGFAAGDFHTIVGLVWLVPAFLLYLGLMWVLRRLVVEVPGPAAPFRAAARPVPSGGPPIRLDRRAVPALLGVSLLLAASGTGFRTAARAARAHLEKQPVELRGDLKSIPRRLGDWQAPGREEQRLTEETEEVLGTGTYLERVYERRSGGSVNVFIAYYTGLIDAVPHIPDRCFVAGGLVKDAPLENVELPLDRTLWVPDQRRVNRRSGEPYPLLAHRHPVLGHALTVCMPVGEPVLRVGAFRDPDRPRVKLYAGYFFLANGEMLPSPEKVRLFAFNLESSYAYYAKVQFSMYAPQEAGRDEFVAAVTDLLQKLLPELMSCLPDWAEIETLEAGAETAAAGSHASG